MDDSPLTWHARAPTRIDFAGGWTDVPDFAEREGGVVVNAAITRYVRVEARRGGKGIRLNADDLGMRVRYATSSEISYDGRLDLHKAALNMFPITGGVEVISNSDLPAGSGLGASGALDVALVAAVSRLRGDWYDKEELAELGFHLEALELKLLGGRQDQYAAALGGFQHLSFSNDPVIARPLAVSPEQAVDLARHVVLVYTGESHFSSDTHRRVWHSYEQKRPAVVSALHTIKDLAPRVVEALEAADWRRLSELVNCNWEAQQSLDATICTEGMQRVEQAARGAGAWGVKAVGAGAGGCLVIFCSATERDAVAAATKASGATVLDVGFDFAGVTIREEQDAGSDAG